MLNGGVFSVGQAVVCGVYGESSSIDVINEKCSLPISTNTSNLIFYISFLDFFGP